MRMVGEEEDGRAVNENGRGGGKRKRNEGKGREKGEGEEEKERRFTLSCAIIQNMTTCH